MSGQAGARWLARELYEIGAATDTLGEGGDPAVNTQMPPQVYPLLWRLDMNSIEALASVCGQSVGEFVMEHGGTQ